MAEQVQDVAALVVRAKRGETGAQAELFRRLAPAAYRVALALTAGDRAEAEDLLQEVFVTCLSRLHELREPGHFPGWLLRSVRNRAINRSVQERNRRRLLGKLFEVGAPPKDPFEQLVEKQQLEIVQAVFAAIDPGPLKETAQLYYFEGVESVAEIAHRLSIPKSTVTTRLDRFRQLLKKRLLSSALAIEGAGRGGSEG